MANGNGNGNGGGKAAWYSPEALGKFVERVGVPTVLMFVFIYISYRDLLPLLRDYLSKSDARQQRQEEVITSLSASLRELAETNEAGRKHMEEASELMQGMLDQQRETHRAIESLRGDLKTSRQEG